MIERHAQSLAATSRAAHDLASNLDGLLHLFDDLRRADTDQPPEPKPTWWDGYVNTERWQRIHRSGLSEPNRKHRITYVRKLIEECIRMVEERWPQLTSPIAMTVADARLFNACKESLRNLAGILSPYQERSTLRYEVIPDERHLATALPEIWDEEPESEEERRAEDAKDEAAIKWINERSRSPNSDETARAYATLQRLDAAHSRLRKKREARNERGRIAARRDGRVSTATLREIEAEREHWHEQIIRWRLGEQDVRNLLNLLTRAHMDFDAQASTGSGRGTDQAKPTDPTMRDLATEVGISDDTFRRVRKAAKIEVKVKGARARSRRYSPSEIDRLIKAALAGSFLERTSMAEKWARWSSKYAADKPQGRK